VLSNQNVTLSLEGWFAFIAIVIVAITVFLVARRGRTYHIHFKDGTHRHADDCQDVPADDE
jgi:hypothetical protein